MPQPIIRSLPVALTSGEIRDRAQQQARVVKELQDLRVAKKLSAANFKQKIDSGERELLELAAAVRDGKENRPVECYERPNRERKVIETARCDNGEVVDTREMTKAEAQMSISELQESLDFMTRDD